MSMRLVITSGAFADAIFELAAGTATTIGRGEDCDIQVDDLRMSRTHCRVTIDDGRAVLEDAGSRWGTFVNGEQVISRALEPGDIVRVGDTELRLEVASKRGGEMSPLGAEVPGGGPSSELQPQTSGTVSPSSAAISVHGAATLVGRTLHRFRIEELLARGKSGFVFRAVDTRHNRPVALKVLRQELAVREEDRQRFVRSVEAIKEVRHENLVVLHAAGRLGPWCWTASELVEGQSLAQLMDRAGQEGRLPWRQVLKVGIGVAAALEAAARAGVLHRNITPNNVLVRQRDGMAKLNDLSLVKALEGTAAAKITQPGESLGELPYLSPEQLVAPEAVDGRADIYGLGATLYAALAGIPPVKPGTLSDTLRRIIGSTPQRPSELNPEVPRELDEAIMRMLARRPENRYQTPTELLNDLQAIAAGSGVELPTSEATASVVATAGPVIVVTEAESWHPSQRRRGRRRRARGLSSRGKAALWVLAGAAAAVAAAIFALRV
ncbi:MAG: protein kinase [Planctomycetes bacterium]|nr:protein kinase [Planctomycetota bacterium]